MSTTTIIINKIGENILQIGSTSVFFRKKHDAQTLHVGTRTPKPCGKQRESMVSKNGANGEVQKNPKQPEVLSSTPQSTGPKSAQCLTKMLQSAVVGWSIPGFFVHRAPFKISCKVVPPPVMFVGLKPRLDV